MLTLCQRGDSKSLSALFWRVNRLNCLKWKSQKYVDVNQMRKTIIPTREAPGCRDSDGAPSTNNASIRSLPAPIPAAKLHILGLRSLKNRLGPKWDHVSGRASKLVQRTVARAQSPTDRFKVLDEHSYLVTFGDLSVAETIFVCTSIAKKVCELFLGCQIDEISIRTVVAIVSPVDTKLALTDAQIEAVLERSGSETVVTQGLRSDSKELMIAIAGHRLGPPRRPLEQIQLAHAELEQFGLRVGLFPVWELRKGTSSALFLVPFSGNAAGRILSGRPALVNLNADEILNVEINLLGAAEAYTERLQADGTICAIGVGVSYDSLCSINSRIRYVSALKKGYFSPRNPLWLKIEQIPPGIPGHRVAAFVTMLSSPNIRVTLEFQSLISMPEPSVRLKAGGLGGSIPAGTVDSAALIIAERLVSLAAAQEAFAFLNHLDKDNLVAVARHANVRFGTGAALGTRHLAGLEAIPTFPLSLVEFG